MDFRRQSYFLAVAQKLGFRRAAEALNISQPALSQQISSLEEDLGLKLFERNGRSTKLTPAGEEYYQGVVLILDEIAHWERRARAAAQGASGSLTIGVNMGVLHSTLPDVIRSFRSQYPSVLLNLITAPPPEALRLVRDRHVDLAFTAFSSSDEELQAEFLWRFPLRLVVPVDHPLADPANTDFDTLNDDTLILPGRKDNLASYERTHKICRALGIKPKEIEVHSEPAWLSIVGMISCGLGFSFASTAYAQLRPNNILFRDVGDFDVDAQISICRRTDDRRPLTQKFVDFVRDFSTELRPDLVKN